MSNLDCGNIYLTDSKTSQTDEEKQRERQRCEREAKKEEQDALNYKVN